MFLLEWLVHLVWSIVTLPFHLLAWIVKYFIVVPAMMIVMLIAIVIVCVGLAIPGSLQQVTLPTIAVPEAVNDFASGLKSVTLPQAPLIPATPTQVICVTESNVIVMRWTAQRDDGAQWYQVVRRQVGEDGWRRIALISARDSASEQYEFRDADVQRGVTYIYGVIAIAEGEESEVAVSHNQIVAP